MLTARLLSVAIVALLLDACAATPAPTAQPTATRVLAASAPTGVPTLPPVPAVPTATRVPPSPIAGTPATVAAHTPAAAATFDPATTSVRLEPVAKGLRLPVDIRHAGDGSNRLFVVEKAGVIRNLRNGVPLPDPFLDISAIVRSTESERGLLGLAFHPRYRANGHFFVYYTDASGDIVVARYTAPTGADAANAGSALEILRVRHRDASNHNGGNLVFGPDGYLYIGTGDGGGAGDRFGNSQKPDSLLAKLLRLDVDGGTPYAVPKDNPFVARAGFRPEIWAWGLRNPWRFAFDRLSGDLFIADVGQNVWEEINFQPAASKGGENYGWNVLEGAHCYPAGAACEPSAFVAPVAEYSHAEGGCSITGGNVYRGKAQPALNGAYFYGDYCSGNLWALSRDARGAWRVSPLPQAHGIAISTFGEDEAGEIYLADLNGGGIYRLVAAAR